MSSDSRPSQFVALAGLRGVAALCVVQFHFPRFLGGTSLPAGYLAVDFFFLLSGWVLAHAYDRRLEAGMTAGQFMRARLIRLYPVYLLGVLLAFAGTAAGGASSWTTLLFSLAFLPVFAGGNLEWLVQASWSLTAELAANLPFAAFHRRLGTPLLVAVVAAAFAGLVLCGLSYGSLDIGHNLQTWPGLFARVFFSFPLGVLLYRHRSWLAARAPAWSTWPSFVLLAAVLALPAAANLHVLRDTLIVALILPAILLFAANARPRPLTARVANLLGDVSYPLYLLHVALFDAINFGLVATLGYALRQAPLPLLLPLLATPLLIAWAVDRWFDRPIRRLLLAGGPAPAALVGPAA